jgi:hypothetical protein
MGRQHLIDGKTKEAREVFGPIAFSPHGGAARERALAIIAGIDEGKSGPDIVAALRKEPQDAEEDADR